MCLKDNTARPILGGVHAASFVQVELRYDNRSIPDLLEEVKSDGVVCVSLGSRNSVFVQ